MNLYLCRHGEYLLDPKQSDYGLTLQGQEDIAKIACFFKQQIKNSLAAIYHSSKLRTQQTAEIIHQTLAQNIPLMSLTSLHPLAPLEPVIEQLLTEKNDILFVTHLPFIQRLVSKLLLDDEYKNLLNLPVGCLVKLEFHDRQWSLAWLVNPELC